MSKNNTLIISKKDLQGRVEASELVTQELEDAVDAGNGRCRSFVYDAEELIELAKRAEKRLDRNGLPQAMRPGFEASFRPEGPWANSYRYPAATRVYYMKRTTKGWILTGIEEDQVYPKAPELTDYTATEKQVLELAQRAVADITARKIEVSFV